MTRRELLQLTASSMLYGALAPLSGIAGTREGGKGPRLFFNLEDLPRIKANTRTPMLASLYDEWKASPPSALPELMDKFEESGEIIRDFIAVLRELAQSALIHLVEPDKEREATILNVIERIIAAEKWDYFVDGGTEVIGIQRASFATVRMLFVREVLGDAISPELDDKLMKAIAEKGCLPCYRTVYDMENPDTVKGWGFDEKHAGFYDITMERWPMILGANNLRSAPTGALGLGAIALLGKDPRAGKWLKAATESTERFLKLFTPDGSYFEGLSYLGYSLRTAVPFMRAHQSHVGGVDWWNLVNYKGMMEYVMTMQMGRRDNGLPDIVNFSDANYSVAPGVLSVIGEKTGIKLANHAARETGEPKWVFDFLWYRPDAPGTAPDEALLNMRNDLNWIICRSGWKPKDSVIAFKSGGPANHEHADRNHITFKAHGERLLNDHFGASYDRRNPGWMMRQARAHNCILIDGKGHPYIEGLEGTNDSKAYANVLSFKESGNCVWWTSDASSAYILNNYHVMQVLRSVIFAKPDVLVVMDQIRLRYRPQVVDARFYPDNADGLANLSADGNRFTLGRPKATLHGLVASSNDVTTRLTKLEVPEETGVFPCVEVHSVKALTHQIITVLASTPGKDSASPKIKVKNKDGNWKVSVNDFEATIRAKFYGPQIKIS